MNKFEKFLKDNKGASYSPIAVKQLLIKFIELMSKAGTVKYEASNIGALSSEVLDGLQVGDIVQKITGKQKHCYVVTYKGDGAGEGICLTYCAAGYMETVSYDRSGSSWIYNSTDVVSFSAEDIAWVEEMKGKISVSEDGIEVDGVIHADKVVEEDDTELIDLTSYVNTNMAKSNTLYAKLLVKHNVLYLVVSGQFVSAGFSASNLNVLSNFMEAIPTSLKSKIYRANGTSIDQPPGVASDYYNFIAGTTGIRSYSGSSSSAQPFIFSSSDSASLTLQMRPSPSIAEDVVVFIDCRIALTI